MNIDQAFKLYDVRGDYPQDVDERLAFAIGYSLATNNVIQKVLIACDSRSSSPKLKKYLADGLASVAVSVFDLGEAPIPQFYFAMNTEDFDFGVMVTASHVKESENGFKFVHKGGSPFDQKEIADLKMKVGKNTEQPIVIPKRSVNKFDNTSDYLRALLSKSETPSKEAKIILDVDDSAVAKIVSILFSQFGPGFEIISPNHSPNPLLPQNQEDLKKVVKEKRADLGIAWDSDGDRVVFIDSAGEQIPMSFAFGLLASDAIARGPGHKVAVDVRAGLVVRDLVEKAGGELLVLPTWSQTFKFAMKADKDIVFGGEISGHFIYQDFYQIDDAIYAALRFVNISERPDFKSQLSSLQRRYFELPEKNFPCALARSVVVLEKLTEYYRSKDYLVSIEDGLTVFGKEWKFNLRSSLTEPYLRLNLEARSELAAKKIISEIEKHLD